MSIERYVARGRSVIDTEAVPIGDGGPRKDRRLFGDLEICIAVNLATARAIADALNQKEEVYAKK